MFNLSILWMCRLTPESRRFNIASADSSGYFPLLLIKFINIRKNTLIIITLIYNYTPFVSMELSLLLSVSIWIRVSVCVCMWVCCNNRNLWLFVKTASSTQICTHISNVDRETESEQTSGTDIVKMWRGFHTHTTPAIRSGLSEPSKKKQQQHNKNNCNTKNEKRTMKITRNRPATSNQQYTVLTQYHIIHTEPKMIFLFIPISFNWNQFLLFNLTVNLIVSHSLSFGLCL